MGRGRCVEQERRPAHAPPLSDLFTFLPVHPELRQGGRRGCYYRPQPGRYPAVRGVRPSGTGGERPVLPDPVRPPRGGVHPTRAASWRTCPPSCAMWTSLASSTGALPRPVWHGSRLWRRRSFGRRASPWTWETAPRQYAAFERSNSMSRQGRLSFLRADLWETVRRRIMLDLELGQCQLSKLYAYNGLMLSTGTRWRVWRSTGPTGSVVVDNHTLQRSARVITVAGCGRHGQCAALPPCGAGGGLFRHRIRRRGPCLQRILRPAQQGAGRPPHLLPDSAPLCKGDAPPGGFSRLLPLRRHRNFPSST